MLKWLLLLLLYTNLFTTLFALEVTLQGAKENFSDYSTLHLKDPNPFLCQEIKNDFEIVTKIVCAFSQEPSKEFNKIQNDFFEIDTQMQKKTFFLIVHPFYKMQLFPMVFDLSEDDTVYKANVKLAKHWMIVGYKEKLPLIKETESAEKSINFPFTLTSDKLPYVGGLDIKGNPVHIKRVKDVSDYIKIKKYYKEKKYDLCLNLIDEVMLEYPNSLFKGELLFYKIRVFAKLKNYDDLIATSKEYLKEYSSDEHVPEVLALTAQAYSKIGLSTDADYFFDRLFSEHKNSKYTQWGYIYMGNMLEEAGSSSKAVNFYEKALNETNDIEVAVTAAYALAKYNLNHSKIKDAATYVMKIVKAKPDFFMQDLKTSLDMMNGFAQEGDYETAAAIAKAIVDASSPELDEYEELLKNIGIWLAKTDKKQEALDALNRYLQTYKYGTYEEDVQAAKDSLFFESEDENLTSRLQKYNELIDTYGDDSIGERAIYEKAKLLLENKMYSDVLAMKDSLESLEREKYPEVDNIISQSVTGLMELSLKNKKCQEVLNLSNEYNIALSDKWDDGIYECAMKGGDFELSKKIVSKNLNAKDLDERKKWLYRYINVDFATGNYSEVIDASKELITLIEDEKDSQYNEVYRILFDAYQRVEKKDKLIEAITKIQDIFGLSYKDIERYVAVMALGSERGDNNMVIKYGNDVMKIQNSSNSYAQSPFVEFTLYQAYIDKNDYNKALQIIKSLNTLDLTPNQRARQKYLLGSVYEKLWREDDAQKAYEEAIKAKADSPWAKLAKEAKSI